MTDIDLSGLAAGRDGSRPLRGYLASPAGTGPWPAVVMIHEIFASTTSCAATPDLGLGGARIARRPLPGEVLGPALQN